MPDTRESLTHKFRICGHEGYITVGLFEDGRPGEVFIKMAKWGSTMSGLLNAVGVLSSLALQYGVPVDALAAKFEGVSFQPSGTTSNPDLREVNSVIEYIFKWVTMNTSSNSRHNIAFHTEGHEASSQTRNEG